MYNTILPLINVALCLLSSSKYQGKRLGSCAEWGENTHWPIRLHCKTITRISWICMSGTAEASRPTLWRQLAPGLVPVLAKERGLACGTAEASRPTLWRQLAPGWVPVLVKERGLACGTAEASRPTLWRQLAPGWVPVLVKERGACGTAEACLWYCGS